MGDFIKIYTAFKKTQSISSETSTNVARVSDNKLSIECLDDGGSDIKPVPIIISSLCSVASNTELSDANSAAGFSTNLCKYVPQHFPIQACQFDINAKILLSTGKCTKAGKRAVVTALLAAMRTYERYICDYCL